MSLVRYEPWNVLNQLHGDLDRFFDRRPGAANDNSSSLATSDWTPAVDIKEEDDCYVIHADVPGVEPKDIDVSMEEGVLTIHGKRNTESRDEGEGYKRVERVRGSFYRRFNLPDTANVDAISAKSKHGVLEVVIPKQEKLQPKRIEVKG